MERKNILDQFSVFQFGKETVNIPMQKRQMFETEDLVSQFSTITTHLSFGPGVTCIHACFSFYTNINFTTTICLYISLSPPITELLQDGMVCTEVDESQGRPVSYARLSSFSSLSLSKQISYRLSVNDHISSLPIFHGSWLSSDAGSAPSLSPFLSERNLQR